MKSCNFKHLLIVLPFIILLNGCASYQAQPLAVQNTSTHNLNILSVEANKILQSRQEPYTINLNNGLDLTEIAILAVLGNPSLNAQRSKYEIAGAQVFSAGLLPDPQLAMNIDKPSGNTAGLVNAWGVGIGYDIMPLIIRQAQISNLKHLQQKIQLEILWQEWQVVQQARSLAVSYKLEERRLVLLQSMKKLYNSRYQYSKKGMREGNILLDVNGTDLTALIDVYSQISQLEQQHNNTSYALKKLLGLPSDALIKLIELPEQTRLNRSKILKQLDKLPELRPDLLALKAGYQSQEEKVREAILGQFPAISLGITKARDTGGIDTNGFNIGLTLPLFNANRGGIATERATRKQLSEEYTARILQANNNVNRLLELQDIIEKQQVSLDKYLPRLKTLVDSARKAYDRGDINALTFLNMESTWVNKRLEQISLLQTLWENQLALQTLLAIPNFQFKL